jgi:hypothetical protein
MDEQAKQSNSAASLPSPALVAAAGWALPGLGYILMRERARGITIMVAVLFLYVFGLLIANVRVIDVPGYDKSGFEDRVDNNGQGLKLGGSGYANGHWAILSGSFLSEVAGKPWYVGQIFVGPLNLIASEWSLHAARQNVPMVHARLAEIGTLYTAVAGMLNLLAIIDSASRAANDESWEHDEPADAAVEGQA